METLHHWAATFQSFLVFTLPLISLLSAAGGTVPSKLFGVQRTGNHVDNDPIRRLKVYVYELPGRYNEELVRKDARCFSHMFATEIYLHKCLLSNPVRTYNPDEADWFFTPVYTTCDLTNNGLPLPFKSPQMMRSAIRYISEQWPYWNRTEGADHFFIVPHDFGACFHYKVLESTT